MSNYLNDLRVLSKKYDSVLEDYTINIDERGFKDLVLNIAFDVIDEDSKNIRAATIKDLSNREKL